jgi:hypothetical protein
MGSVRTPSEAEGIDILFEYQFSDITDRSAILGPLDGYTLFVLNKYRLPWWDHTNKYGVVYRHHDNGRIELLGRNHAKRCTRP